MPTTHPLRRHWAFVSVFVAYFAACNYAGDQSLSDTASSAYTDSSAFTLWSPVDGFSEVGALAVDRRGNVIASDRQSGTVYVIDERNQGRELLTRGSGPGEAQFVSAIAPLPDGRIAVLDMGLSRLLLFDSLLSSASVRAVRSSELLGQSALKIIDDTLVVVGALWQSRSKVERNEYRFAALADDGSERPLASSPLRLSEECPLRYLDAEAGVIDSYSPAPVFAVLSDGSTIEGCASSGRLQRRRADGSFVDLKLDAEPIERSADEIQSLIEAFEKLMRREVAGWRWPPSGIPPVHPAFSRVLEGIDGTVWVVTPRPSSRCAADDPCVWRSRFAFAVFDTSGKMIRERIDLPTNMSLRVDPVLSLDAIVGVHVGNDGVETIVRLPLRSGVTPLGWTVRGRRFDRMKR